MKLQNLTIVDRSVQEDSKCYRQVLHDLIQKAMNFNDVDIVRVKRGNYRIHFWYISKDDVINTMKNSDLEKVDCYKKFSSYKR